MIQTAQSMARTMALSDFRHGVSSRGILNRLATQLARELGSPRQATSVLPDAVESYSVEWARLVDHP